MNASAALNAPHFGLPASIPVNVIPDPVGAMRFKFSRYRVISAWSGDDQVQRLVGARGIAGHERFDQQFAAFLFVETTQEEQKPPAAELRKAVEEILARGREIDLGRRCSIIHDHFIASIKGKGFSGQTPFLFRGEKDRRGVPQHAIFSPGPVEQFLEVFQRIGPLEPWIEHSVGKNEVRRRSSAQRAPDAEAAVLPEALNNNSVIMRVPFPDPTRETRRESVTAAAGAKRMHGHRTVPHPRIRRRIQRNDLHLMAPAGENSRRLLD